MGGKKMIDKLTVEENLSIATLWIPLYAYRKHEIFYHQNIGIRPKKKTSLFPVAGLKIAMRNAVFLFFFLQFMKKQCAMRFLFF